MKNPFLSKTLWFNILTTGASIVGVIPIKPEKTIIVSSIINIGLRLLTNQPLGLFK